MDWNTMVRCVMREVDRRGEGQSNLELHNLVSVVVGDVQADFDLTDDEAVELITDVRQMMDLSFELQL